MKTKIKIALSMLIILIDFSSCKKFLAIDGPVTSVNSLNIYENDATAIGVLNGLYAKLSVDYLTGGSVRSISLLSGLSADEFILNNASSNLYLMKFKSYYSNSLNGSVAGFEFWNSIYPDLYIVNAALEGISSSDKLTPPVKRQLLGESYFMRAFYLFYLVNLYGDVPLITSTDYKINAIMSRSPKEKVWLQIIEDLKISQDLLDNNYVDASLTHQTNERIRPNKAVATALLARAYLYTKDWVNAKIQATEVINNSAYHLVTLDEVFKKNSGEAIWQIQPVSLETARTSEADYFVIDLTSPNGKIEDRPVFLNTELVNDFDNGDQRKNHWINSVTVNGVTYYYAYKYKVRSEKEQPITEYPTVMRMAEQYLIRAEAYIHLGKVMEGISDLNVLRERATNKTPGTVQLGQLSNLTIDQALGAVEHERRSELFTEWGQRWLDLKRTDRVDEVMRLALPKKVSGAVWKSYQKLYPVDNNELRGNSNLVQNLGY